MRGTATIPLMTALQNKAFIGLIGKYWMKDVPVRRLFRIPRGAP
jgi:hypothetical protein